MISIKGLSKAEVFAALYNAAMPPGANVDGATGFPDTLSVSAAAVIVEAGTEFDYWKGRSLKVEFEGDSFDPGCYNRDNGAGLAEEAVRRLMRASNADIDMSGSDELKELLMAVVKATGAQALNLVDWAYRVAAGLYEFDDDRRAPQEVYLRWVVDVARHYAERRSEDKAIALYALLIWLNEDTRWVVYQGNLHFRLGAGVARSPSALLEAMYTLGEPIDV